MVKNLNICCTYWLNPNPKNSEMRKPRSAAYAHKTAQEDLELIREMAARYTDHEIARVLSSLGRKTGKGKRWTNRRVAYIRKHNKLESYDPNVLSDTLSMNQAAKVYDVSCGTIKRLIDAKILVATQVAPCAPLEIKREDLESKTILNIIETLKRTGKLVLDGAFMANQGKLFDYTQSLTRRGVL